MAFLWTTLHVSDINASVKFYEEAVGLVTKRRFKPREGMEIVFLGLSKEGQETEVELICDQSKLSYPQSDQISIGFVCESLEAKIEKLGSMGMEAYTQPVQPNPYLRFFYVKDPDGISVQFVEHLS